MYVYTFYTDMTIYDKLYSNAAYHKKKQHVSPPITHVDIDKAFCIYLQILSGKIIR